MAEARTAAGVAPPTIAYRAMSATAGQAAYRPSKGFSAPWTMRANTATLSPLSTSRWIKPVAMRAFWSSAGMPWRIPSTIPSRTAACGAGSAAFTSVI